MLRNIPLILLLILVSSLLVSGCSSNDPNHQMVRDAVQLAKEGKYSQAIDIYSSIIKKGVFADDKTNLAIIYYNRGLAHTGSGQFQQAVDDYSQALKHRPNFPTCLHNRSVVYEKMGDIAKAIADVKSLLVLEPSDEDAVARLHHLNEKMSAK